VPLNIRKLNPNIALHDMVVTLKPKPFLDILCEKPTFDLD